jgi:hypothetical protein
MTIVAQQQPKAKRSREKTDTRIDKSASHSSSSRAASVVGPAPAAR